MNKPLRLSLSKYDRILFASDFHFNHQRDFLWKPRGFTSFQDHDKFIEDQCSKLTERDLLIYLGDYSLNTTDEQTSALLHKTKAKIFYIAGNHEGFHDRFYRNSLQNFCKRFVDDSSVKAGLARDHASLAGVYFLSKFQIFPFSVNKTTNEGTAGITEVLKDIVYFGEEGYFAIGKNNFFCRHMAPLIWDKMKYDNFFAICGHSHGNLHVGKPTVTDGGKILDVGVDNAIIYNGSAFFSVQDVEAIMKTKETKIYDHHGDDNI